MTPTLFLESVHLSLPSRSGPVEILRGVHLSVEEGEVLALVGPSGSGKSSLISVAAGLEPPTAGRVCLLGEDLRRRSEDELARLRRGRVSLVFQSFHLIPTMTALDNVRVPMEVAGFKDAAARARAGLEEVGLGHRLRHYPGQLSGGERQRVAVARALAPDPQIVFADEPTGNLDSQTGEGVADRLIAIAREKGASLVLVTHDPVLARRGDRIVQMKDGVVVS
ncbi:ABC transporter ATP-binding protein [Maricaulis sp. D1M11]|uniref:ABC transporter ATP-binding protein n=1 Tax=Maricaulis sp. D1M11 TaxID=3076117 RepID=UPI0039B46F4C